MSDGPVILAAHYGGHDTSAALMIDGRLVAACEQERYDGQKHSRAFPVDAIQDCLKLGGVTIGDIDELGWSIDPIYWIRETYLRLALEDPERIGFMIKDIERIKQMYFIDDFIREKTAYQGQIEYHLHHWCHLASAYYPSGFDQALLASYDGTGEIETSLLAVGKGGEIEEFHDGVRYPHSLGLLYSAVTFYLGWRHHCDEGIIMGLAPYGDADAKVPGRNHSYRDAFEEIVVETGPYTYEIDTSWIEYHRVRDTWISEKFTDCFGPTRQWEDPLAQEHMNVAAALQRRTEDIIMAHLSRARLETGAAKLALAGGVGLNCTMNGKIEASGLFDEIFVQPAAGDSGCPVGACYLSHKRLTGVPPSGRVEDFYLGSGFTDEEVCQAFAEAGLAPTKSEDLATDIAAHLGEGKIIGWFQGRSEFGPRALGNRSILTRPYPAEMKDYLNSRVKFREYFRPFAPAIALEYAPDYFSVRQHSPHMLIACQIEPTRKDEVPAVVHVDDSCRVQTVTPENNKRFYDLLQEFRELTGCPVLLNTSFNVKGQPIVNTPRQAIGCFQGTNIDVLVLGDYYVEKTDQDASPPPA